MINPAHLTDDLARKVAHEAVCACCQEVAIKNVRKMMIEDIKLGVSGIFEKAKNSPVFAELFKRLLPHEKKIVKLLKRVWEKERRIIVANLKKLKKAWMTKDDEAIVESILYPRAPFEKEIAADMAAIGVEIVDEQGKIIMNGLDIGVAFDVKNPEVTKWLKGYYPMLSKELEAVNVEKLKRELIAGLEAGESIPQLTKRVNTTYANWNKVRSVNISRSEALRASNMANRFAFLQSGVVTKLIWDTFFDLRTCIWCEDMDGKVVGIENNFFDKGDVFTVESEGKKHDLKLDYTNVQAPPLHPMCLLPGTKCVSPSGFISGLSAMYNGKAIELMVSDGSIVTVTSNHLLLTPYGFSPAYLLREGDNIIYCPDLQGIISSNPDYYRYPSLAEDIIESLSEDSSMVTSRVPVSPEYLHGDGRFANGYVNIIHADGFLRDTVKAFSSKHISTNDFNSSDRGLSSFHPFGDFATVFKRLAFSADGIMGGFRKSSPFFLRRLTHPDEHRLASISGLDSYLKETATDDGTGYIEMLRTSLLRHSAFVKISEIVMVNIYPFHGFVYDMQTSNSLYTVNGVVSSNCRCTISPEVE